MQICSNQQNINSNQKFGAYITVRNLSEATNASEIVADLKTLAESFAPKAKENGGDFFTGVCKELLSDENHTIIDKFVISTGDDAIRGQAEGKNLTKSIVRRVEDILEKHGFPLNGLFDIRHGGIGKIIKNSDKSINIDIGDNFKVHHFKKQADGSYVSEKL